MIHQERDGEVLVVSIDREGDELNRVDGQLHSELAELFARLKEETSARAVVLRSEGRAFSAGGDFAWFPAMRESRVLEQVRREGKQLIWDLLDVPLPLVAAIEGPAIGLGASVVLLCDAAVMARSATIADPHVRVGIAAGDGGTVAWPLALGPMLAKRYLLTGDAVAADDALRMGLVTEVVDDGEATAVALGFAHRIAAGAPLAVQYTKQAVNQWVKQVMTASFDLATALEMVTFRSADHAEALEAMSERRPPHFEGR